jgi:hypothetical protein
VLAKQVLSQLSYTPTREAALILKHFPPLRIPILRQVFITRSRCAKVFSEGNHFVGPPSGGTAQSLIFVFISAMMDVRRL